VNLKEKIEKAVEELNTTQKVIDLIVKDDSIDWFSFTNYADYVYMVNVGYVQIWDSETDDCDGDIKKGILKNFSKYVDGMVELYSVASGTNFAALWNVRI